MKCLCFSDSHGRSDAMRIALNQHPDADAVFFLGDGLSDVKALSRAENRIKWFCVRGNCDITPIENISRIIKKTDEVLLFGKKIVFTHGDLYGVKSSLSGIKSLAAQSSADIVLFGHTHLPCEEYISIDGRAVWLFNPGSVSHELSHIPTYGVIIISEDGSVRLDHFAAKSFK